MWQYFKFILSLFILTSGFQIQAENCCNSFCISPKKHKHHFYIGPSLYYINRKREGGSHQTGPLYGVRLGYDHLWRYNIYWGAEFLYGQGHLTGRSAAGKRIKSEFTDTNVEGRLGYTLQQKCFPKIAFTPFVGGGYSVEKNNFKKPSPLPVHFRLHYAYWCVGFFSQISYWSCLDVGFNFTAKFMIEGKNKASHDPEFDDSSTLIGNRQLYKAELPITYHWNSQLFVCFDPFYEYRHYGHHAGYPFDFLETRMNIYGATLKIGYSL